MALHQISNYTLYLIVIDIRFIFRTKEEGKTSSFRDTLANQCCLGFSNMEYEVPKGG